METKYEGRREVQPTNLSVSAAHSVGEECVGCTPLRLLAYRCQGVPLDKPPLCTRFLHVAQVMPRNPHPKPVREVLASHATAGETESETLSNWQYTMTVNSVGSGFVLIGFKLRLSYLLVQHQASYLLASVSSSVK